MKRMLERKGSVINYKLLVLTLSIFFIIFLLSDSLAGSNSVECGTLLTKFSDGYSSKLIEFPPGGGTNTSAKIEIPLNSSIKNATVDLTGLPVFFTAEKKVDVSLVNDVSGSMDDNCPGGDADPGETPCKINDMKNASKQFVNLILTSPDNNVSLVSYATWVVNFTGLTKDNGTLIDQIDTYGASGLTCISCGIEKAIEILQSGVNPIRAIVLMTDGNANRCIAGACTPTAAKDEAIAKAMEAWQNHSIKVYTVAFGTDADNDTMEQIANVGNGIFYFAAEANISEVYSEIAIVITATYPTNPTLDVGGDGDNEWSYAGSFETSETADIKNEMNSFLPDCICAGCSKAGGNCTIDLELYSETAGKIMINNTYVVYHPTTEMDCTDGEDNDCDGYIDCADSDCFGVNLGIACGSGICEGTRICNSELGQNTWYCSSQGTECSRTSYCDDPCDGHAMYAVCDVTGTCGSETNQDDQDESGCEGFDCGVCAVCDVSGGCTVYDDTQDADCDPNDLPEIATCFNDPDTIDYTWDSAPAFDSECSGIFACTQGSYVFTHTCDISECGAECEDNSDCIQTDEMCDYQGRVYCTRDGYGTCTSECVCVEDQWSCGSQDGEDYCLNCDHCSDGTLNCQEECEYDGDCQNYCDGATRYYNGACGGCECFYSSEDCSKLTGWYDTSGWTYYDCERCKDQEYREYSCSPSECIYAVTDTGEVCENINEGLVCDTGAYECVDDCSRGQPEYTCQSGECLFYQYINQDDCSPYSCYSGACNGCSQLCGAGCEEDMDCSGTDCDHLDGCYDNRLRDCDDVENTCESNCECTEDSCPAPTECPHVGTDQDGDGFDAECGDCNDTDDTVYPGAPELCDGKDNDCDGTVDEDACLCERDGDWGEGHEFMCRGDGTYDRCNEYGTEYEHVNICEYEHCTADPECDGYQPLTYFTTCTMYGESYLQDYCDDNCALKDDRCEDDFEGCTSDPECDEKEPGTDFCTYQCDYKPEVCLHDGMWGDGHEFRCMPDNTYEECNDDGTGYDHVNICKYYCSASIQCEGVPPGAELESCDFGENFLQDYCNDTCMVQDDNCEDDYEGCMSDPECDENVPGEGIGCDSFCSYHFCGDGVMDNSYYGLSEQCEYPLTPDNEFCTQSEAECQDKKLGTRDGYGDCDEICVCLADPFVYACVEGECGAECDENDDCESFCTDDVLSFNGVCDLDLNCNCSYDTQDCNEFDDDYPHVYCDLQTGDIYTFYEDWICEENGEAQCAYSGYDWKDGLVEDCEDTCYDTDGQDHFTQGTVTDDELCSEGQDTCPYQEFTDYCIDSENLNEYYCSGEDHSYEVKDCNDYNYHEEWEYYCKDGEIWKKRLYHDFYCSGGACAEDTYYVDDQLVENCEVYDGWYNYGNDEGTDDPECEYRDYTCIEDGQVYCDYSVTESHDYDDQDGTYCVESGESVESRDYYCDASGGSAYGVTEGPTDCGEENWAGGGDSDAYGDDPACAYTDYYCVDDGVNDYCDSNTPYSDDFDYMDDPDVCYGYNIGMRDYWCDVSTCDWYDPSNGCSEGYTDHPNGCSFYCGAGCEIDDDCADSTCEETYDDYCEGYKLAEYDEDKVMDSTVVTDSETNYCVDCFCTNNPVECPPPQINMYCVEDECGAECDEDSDCGSNCIGNVFYYEGQCDLEYDCDCSYQTQDCSSLDYYGDYEHYCEGDVVMKKRLFHFYTCDPVEGCVENTEWRDHTIVMDCDDFDNDYCDGDVLKHDDGYCDDAFCKTDTTVTQDCYYYTEYCDGDKRMSETGFCDGGIPACDYTTGEIEDCSDNNYDECQDTYFKHYYTETCQESQGSTQCSPSSSIIDCRDESWCDGQEYCSMDGGIHCEDGTPVDCDDLNECTYDDCIDEGQNQGYCDNSDKPYGTECGLFRDCPDDACDGFFAEFYPDDGHDYCDGYGTCLEYYCTMEYSYCTDDDPYDGVNDLTCGAECDQNEDCPPYLQDDYCFFGMYCQVECTCSPPSTEYCPPPGTVEGDFCYYGVRECTDNGCSIEVCELEQNQYCDPLLGCEDIPCIDVPPITIFSDSSSEKLLVFPEGGSSNTTAKIIIPDNFNATSATIDLTGIPISFTGENVVDVVLVNDVSGSMDDNCGPDGKAQPGETPCKINDMKNASKQFVDVLLVPPENMGGLVSYGTWVVNFTGLTDDENALFGQIDTYVASGKTCISCGIDKAIEIINGGANPVKAIVLMTDGNANRCIAGACTPIVAKDEAIAKAMEAWQTYGIHVYAVAFGDDADTETMQTIASVGNGSYYFAAETNISEVYIAIAVELTQTFPFNPTLNIGSEGPVEWSYAGDFGTTETFSSWVDTLNALSGCACTGCTPSGSCTIDLEVFSAKAGKILLDNLNITGCAFQLPQGNECSSCEECGGGGDCKDYGEWSGWSCGWGECDEEEECERSRSVTTYVCNNPGTPDSYCSSDPSTEYDYDTQTRDTDGDPCDDGLYCTTGDECSNGECSGTQKTCDDSNQCTNDYCSEQLSGECVFENLPDQTECGSPRDCPEDQCVGMNWSDYPGDGHDYCIGGACIVYSCDLISSEYDQICENDYDLDSIPDSQDECPETYGTYCNGCPVPYCSGCAVSYCPAEGVPYCVGNHSLCSPTQCPDDGCGLNGCATDEWADYPEYVDNDCILYDFEGTCETNTCSATCAYDESCVEVCPETYEIDVQTDQSDYGRGDTVTIEGTLINSLCEPETGGDVALTVLDPLETHKYADQLTTGQDGGFSTSFVTGGDWLCGEYMVYAAYDGVTDTTSFVLACEGEITMFEFNLFKKEGGTGKNWISFPLITNITKASELMDWIGPTCDSITRWNPETQTSEGWLSFDGGTGTDFDITVGEGYEVSVTADTTFSVTGEVPSYPLPAIDLVKLGGGSGKNWIGLHLNTATGDASELMADIGGTCDAVTRWNPETQTSEGWISFDGGTGTNFEVKAGEGYEVSVTSNTNWTPA